MHVVRSRKNGRCMRTQAARSVMSQPVWHMKQLLERGRVGCFSVLNVSTDEDVLRM